MSRLSQERMRFSLRWLRMFVRVNVVLKLGLLLTVTQGANQSLIPSSDVIQLTLTLNMTTAQVVETSVTVNNSLIQHYVHPDDHTELTYLLMYSIKFFTDLRKTFYNANKITQNVPKSYIKIKKSTVLLDLKIRK